MNTNPPRPLPWYREPLVWMVLAIPATAVLGGVVMLVLANATWDGLVADDYYRQGMQINRSLARDAEAVRLGLGAALAFPTPGIVEARLTGAHDAAAASTGDRLTLFFAHATRTNADVRVRLARSADGVWRGALPLLPPGKWYVELGNEQWRLAAPVRMPASGGGFVLRAPAPPDRRRRGSPEAPASSRAANPGDPKEESAGLGRSSREPVSGYRLHGVIATAPPGQPWSRA